MAPAPAHPERERAAPRAARRVAPAIALTALLAVLALAHPVLALAAAVTVAGVAAINRLPELAVAAVIFILYSNVAVVATHFHGVPKAVASGFPLLLLIPIARDALLRGRGFIITPALPFLLLFLGVQVLGMAFSSNIEVTRTVVIELVTEGVLLYFLVTNAVRSPKALRFAVWALLLAGFVTALAPLYQQATGSFENQLGGMGQTSETAFRTGDVSSHGEVRQLRLAGPIGEQNRFAQNLLMILPLGLLQARAERSRRRRLVALLFTAFVGTAFLLTFSRGGAVALILVLVAMALLRLLTGRFLIALALAALVALAALPQYWARVRTLSEAPALFSSSPAEVDSSMKRRITEMLAAALAFADHPTIGLGPGMFKYHAAAYGNELGIRKIEGTRKAHSLFLEVAAETGALGLLSFGGMVFVTLQGLLRARKRLLERCALRPDAVDREVAMIATGLLLALIGYLACGIFLHLAYIRFFYAMLALGGAAAWIAEKRIDEVPDGTAGGASRP